jgi:hypothetical protein
MIVYVLTEAEKESLVGQKYTTDSFFNPIQDGNTPANWVISTEEVDQTTNEEFMWVKDLPTITWVPPVTPIEENNP